MDGKMRSFLIWRVVLEENKWLKNWATGDQEIRDKEVEIALNINLMDLNDNRCELF